MRKQASAVWASAMIVRRRGPRKHLRRVGLGQVTRNKAARPIIIEVIEP